MLQWCEDMIVQHRPHEAPLVFCLMPGCDPMCLWMVTNLHANRKSTKETIIC